MMRVQYSNELYLYVVCTLSDPVYIKNMEIGEPHQLSKSKLRMLRDFYCMILAICSYVVTRSYSCGAGWVQV